MKVSIEISMYPLLEGYGTPILEFIDNLKKHNTLQVKSNTMSTQVFGDYGTIMDVLKSEMEKVFLTEDTVVMVMKFVNKNLI